MRSRTLSVTLTPKNKTPLGDSIEGYPRPSLSVDVLLFTVREGALQIALVKRGIEPFLGAWAIPGGFVRMDETLEDAAKREIEEETGVSDVFLEQLYTFGDVNRDPRRRVVTVAYYALVPCDRIKLQADSDADDAQWFPVASLPPLAFDHDKIVKIGLERVKAKIQYSDIAWGLLPARFTLSDLQNVYETILGDKLDKRNFRKRMLASGLLEPTEKFVKGAHRPAQLFRWAKRRKPIW